MRRCLGYEGFECFELVSGRSRCPRCQRRHRKIRGYSTARWKRFSSWYLRRHPICEEPGCTKRSALVHHLYGLRPADRGGREPRNVVALCRQHHADRHAGPDAGPDMGLDLVHDTHPRKVEEEKPEPSREQSDPWFFL